MRGCENDETGDNGLLPGSDYRCEVCGQNSKLSEHAAALWCDSCGDRVCDYDPVDFDRVSLDEKGAMRGRGHGTRIGTRPSGTNIGSTGSVTGDKRRKWNRLSKMDRQGRGGPTRQKLDAVEMVKSFATTDAHYSMAMDLLDIGWPNKDSGRALPAAKEKPIWAAGHPCGVGSSAAACLHVAAIRMGVDSKLSDWAAKCLPTEKYGIKYSFRSTKRLRMILGRLDKNIISPDSNAERILSRAELGGTQYGKLVPRIWECWKINSELTSNLSNHARPVLAALCEILACDEGLNVDRKKIADRFNVGVGYHRWKEQLIIV